jgi:UDP-2-acetamido-3-amino-2,3-dideoxy-glucuronate N-acetyltransferase
MSQESYFAHATAVIDPPCEIGSGTKIWHFSHIMRDCIIGERCNIGQNVVVSPGCKIGSGCKIQNNVSIYTGVALEDDVFCGPSMVFTNVINPRAFIERKSEYRPTLVRRGASIGANATVLCGVTVGRYALIGAGAVVLRDVPDHAIVYGNPGRVHAWVCWCGIRLGLGVDLQGKQQASCASCGRTYTRNGMTILECLE